MAPPSELSYGANAPGLELFWLHFFRSAQFIWAQPFSLPLLKTYQRDEKIYFFFFLSINIQGMSDRVVFSSYGLDWCVMWCLVTWQHQFTLLQNYSNYRITVFKRRIYFSNIFSFFLGLVYFSPLGGPITFKYYKLHPLLNLSCHHKGVKWARPKKEIRIFWK